MSTDNNPTLPQPLTGKFEPEDFYVIYSLWWLVFAFFHHAQSGSVVSIEMIKRFLRPKLGKLMDHIEMCVADPLPMEPRGNAVMIRVHPAFKPTSDYLLFRLDLDRPKRECLTLQSPKGGPRLINLYQLNFEDEPLDKSGRG